MNASTSDVHAARMVFGFTLAVFDILFLGTYISSYASIDLSITLWMLILLFCCPLL